MEPINYIKNHIKTELGISPIHGIGTFAIRSIKKGEKLFPRWEHRTGVFLATPEILNSLPEYSQEMIFKSYVNNLEEQNGYYWFRLFKDCYFNLANPWRWVNASESNNVCSTTKKVVKDIQKGEEILSNYNLKSTLEWKNN